MIAVDWGSSALRLYRLDAQGRLIERRHNEWGAVASRGRFHEVLATSIDGWNEDRILMCGMVGGRAGWQETPYLDCPVGVQDLARGLQRLDAPELAGRELWIVPGVRDAHHGDEPDMMRGEETQIAALLERLPAGNHLVCLPGTHSKWVRLREGRIRSVATAMTGEVYSVLRRYSLLGQLMPSNETRFDAAAFDAGLQRSAQSGGLLHHLFGVRSSGVFRRFDRLALPSYLSGILIGHEVRASGVLSPSLRPTPVHLVGNERLLGSYSHALHSLGIEVQRHQEDLAAQGLHVLWSERQPRRRLTVAAR